jgi:hypothetical protein
VAGELITSTIANTEWRDRMMYLKDSPAFTGSITVAGTINGQTIDGAANLLAGTINGQTISSAANFTGTLTTAGDVTAVGGNLNASQGNTATASILTLQVGAGGGARTANLRQYGNSYPGTPNDFEIITSGDIRLTPTGLDTIVTGRLTVSDNVGLASTKKLYLDGVAMSGDTYITESAANSLDLVSGGVTIASVSGQLALTATKKLFFDGVTATGNTYITETSADVLDLFAGGVKTLSVLSTHIIIGSGLLRSPAATSINIQPAAGGFTGLSISGTTGLTSLADGLTVAAGLLTLSAYTAATFVAGDKYLVVNASGVVHVSALGPLS